jgi:hypothetical protein
MIPLNNYISKTLYDNSEEPHAILVYIDFNTSYNEDKIRDYITTLVEKNPILRQYIVTQDDNLYLERSELINIDNHYSIKYMPEEKFDNEISEMLNKKFTTQEKWFFLWTIDTPANKMRCFFKIDHTYADGYQIIKILTSPFADEDLTKNFKRTSETFLEKLYYFIFGTLMLIAINMRFLFSFLFQPKSANISYKQEETDYILCKGFDLSKIKAFTKKHGITINDFMYSLMIKMSYYYNGQEQTLYTVSSINVSQLKDTNNITPLFLNMPNNYDSKRLLNSVHEMFNSCKYGLFIPALSSLINSVIDLIPSATCRRVHKNIIGQIDYVYSNIIGPSTELNKDVTNIHFLTTTMNRETCFNIISYDNAINIICTFKKGVVTDKERFENAIYKAYNNLMFLTI